MKLIHLSDLHLGKRVNEFSMLEDQRYILEQILSVIDDERADGVIIAGDVYDKSVPSAEAVQLFDDYLCRLAERELQVFVLSGNHDSAERIAFGGRLMDRSGVHMSPVYDGTVTPVELEDEHGTVRVYMLPFIKPAHVRRRYEEEAVESYTDAVRVAVSHMEVDPAVRNVIVAHQFVTGAERSESETVSVGGSDNVDVSVFDGFDYVALGHIHGPQHIGRETVRYCGTPLKYSFSEVSHKKSVTVVELAEKGTVTVRTVPLTPLRDMRELRGTYLELTLRENYLNTATEDYLRITLTDEEDVFDAINRLRTVYPNLMVLDYDNTRTRHVAHLDGPEAMEKKDPLQQFEAFFEQQNGRAMTEEQRAFSHQLIDLLGGYDE